MSTKVPCEQWGAQAHAQWLLWRRIYVALFLEEALGWKIER